MRPAVDQYPGSRAPVLASSESLRRLTTTPATRTFHATEGSCLNRSHNSSGSNACRVVPLAGKLFRWLASGSVGMMPSGLRLTAAEADGKTHPTEKVYSD